MVKNVYYCKFSKANERNNCLAGGKKKNIRGIMDVS